MTIDALNKSIFIDKPWSIKYDGFDLVINVHKRKAEHAVRCSYQLTGKNYQEAFASIFHFFNEIVWFFDLKICNVNGGHSHGSHVSLNYNVSEDRYLFSFKQRVYEKTQHLALAFFREAECNESPYYRLICFAKILEIPFKKKQYKEKKAWVEGKLKELKSPMASSFRDRKVASLGGRSIADWLHKDGRHATAHARLGEIIRDPNDYNDWDEVKWANVIMQELAEMLIIQKLGVLPRDTQ